MSAFFEHSLKSFRHVVKTSLLVYRSTLRKVNFFEFFKIVFGLWAITLQTSGEEFQQRCPNCILRVQRTSRLFANFCHVSFDFVFERQKNLISGKKFRQFCQNCILNVRELFDEFFFQKAFFSIWYLVWAKIFPALSKNFRLNCQNWSSRVQLSTLTKTLCWLCETIFDFGQGNVWFAAENLQPCYQLFSFVSRWAIGRIVLKEISLFLIWFFSDLQVTFFGFFVESFYKWSSKLHFSCHEEHMQWEKHFDKTFFYHFRTMRDIFLNFH